MKQVLIIGAGAAGLLAGIAAAQAGAQCLLLEKMERPGKKLLITGKGRCNLTNNCDIEGFIANLPGNGRFLYSALQRFDNQALLDLLHQAGLATKVERGGRVFPLSDRSQEVVDTLLGLYQGLGGRLLLDCPVKKILVQEGRVLGVESKAGAFRASAVILAAGGSTYPGTGSDGDGVRLACAVGHRATPLLPSLVPLESPDEAVWELQGLALRNVTASLYWGGRVRAQEFGELLFTHFGLSGPIILRLSRLAAQALARGEEPEVVIDLKPALSLEKLDLRLQRDFALYSRKQVKTGLKDLLPSSLIPLVCDRAYLDREKYIHQLSRKERQRLGATLKGLGIEISGTRPLAEAIVTQGGVVLKEVEPKTMASKLVRGLYLAGEVLDVDGYTGGYNLQGAFSSGWTAGWAAAQEG